MDIQGDSTLELIGKWYRKDENSTPPMYVLQPISSEIPEFVNSSGNLTTSIYIALTRYTNITNSKNTAKHHFKLPEKLLYL